MSRPLVVVGDALLDVDLVGTASRLTPDAPVPVVEDVERRERPGGAALAAVIAAAATSREVVLVAPLDSDDGAARLRALLDGRVRLLADPGRPAARRSSSGCGSATTPSSAWTAVRRWRRWVRCRPRRPTRSANAAAVLVADYGRGTTAAPDVRAALAAARGPVVWDPHPRGADPVPSAPGW